MSMNTLHYAPVIIPTLNRHKHFKRCLESLEQCVGAEYTEVYVALDYPPSEKYVDGWKKIDEYLKIKEKDHSFLKLHVIRRDHNYGVLSANSNSAALVAIIVEKYDRYIFTEDDNEMSPNFLEYINKNLDFYESNPNVIAVCGYSYPINWVVSENATCLQENISVPMFGVGFWTNKRCLYTDYLKSGSLLKTHRKTIKSKRFNKMLDAAKLGYFNYGCLISIFKKKEENLFCNSTDISLRCYLAVENKYVISPVLSKVRNHGFDGSGSCCQNIDITSGFTAGTYDYEHQPIDVASSFELIEDTLHAEEENFKLMNAFDYRSPEQMAKTNRIIWLCEHLGVWSAKLYCILALPFEALPYIKHKIRK